MRSIRFREPLNRTTRLVLLTLSLGFQSFAQQSSPSPTNAPQRTPAPAALVTFYSNGLSLEGGLPKQKGAAFKGRLFSDGDQIAFMEPGHFVTISFLPGHYTFVANSWALPTSVGGAHLAIDLVADHRYFIEASSRALPFPSYFSIKQVPCSRAVKDNAQDKPLEVKHLASEAAPFVVAEATFPTCP